MNYEEIYEKYPDVEWLVKETQHSAHTTRYAGILSQVKGRSVLDVGAGVGNLALMLKETHDVTCVDVKDEYVAYLQSLGLNAIKADGNTLPFDDRSFDAVVLSEIVEHMENPGLLIAEAFRVARLQVIFTVPINSKDPPWHLWIVQVAKNNYGAILSFEREQI